MPSPIPKYWLPYMWLQGPPGNHGPIGPQGDQGRLGGVSPPPAPPPPSGGGGGGGHGGGGGISPPPPPALPPAPKPFHYLDKYRSNCWYIENDVVDYNNELWVCTVNNYNNVPNPTSQYWQSLGSQWNIVDGHLKNLIGGD